MKNYTKRITLCITEKLYSYIKCESELRGKTESEIIRKLMYETIEFSKLSYHTLVIRKEKVYPRKITIRLTEKQYSYITTWKMNNNNKKFGILLSDYFNFKIDWSFRKMEHEWWNI